MPPEGKPETHETNENMEELFAREIRKALSPTWAKSTQELLPGYLSNKPRGTYTSDELAQYKIAFGILGAMVKSGEVEVTFEEETAPDVADALHDVSVTAVPRFKLVTHGGKKSETPQMLWQGGLVLDNE